MKKIIKWIFLWFFIAFCFQLSAKVSAQPYLLGMIEVKFCNNNQTKKELDMVNKAGEKLPICVEFTNKATTPITINIEFLDSVITDDNLKDRACNAADRPKTQFGNFMLPYKWEVIIPAQKTIQRKYDIKHPVGFSWWSHGCLAYNIVGEDIKNESMFTIRIRSIKYLDVFVSDTESIQAFALSQKPKFNKIGDEYEINLWIFNKGNIDENIHIKSTLSNIFGFTKEFYFDLTLPANTWMILTTPSFILPVYGWFFWLKSEIAYTPMFNFNITNAQEPSQIYTEGIKNTQTLLFVWTRQSRIMIIILLVFILWIFRISHKKNT